MYTIKDSRTNTTNSNMFLYSPVVPSSPIPSNIVHDLHKVKSACNSHDNKYTITNNNNQVNFKRRSIYQEPFMYEKKPCSVLTTTQLNNKKEKIKKAKDEYEQLIDSYYQQLTIGCQQAQCKNKFCASGGIMSLQPQAALIMSIQLASMPTSRLCNIKKRPQQKTHSSSFFLHSLFSSSSIKPVKQPQQHWTMDFWKLFQHNNDDPSDNDYYYELDSEDEPSVLSIIPVRLIDLDSTLESLHPSETWCRSVFQNWEGIGQSFVIDNHIDLDDLRTLYKACIELHAGQFIAASLEILLDRMLLNDVNEALVYPWARSLIAIYEWICIQQDPVLIQKTIQLTSKIAQQPKNKLRKLLKDDMFCMDNSRIVKIFQQYLSDHFHTAPYKLEDDSVVMTLQSLELLYESNPSSCFYSPEICKRLNIKTEYRVWVKNSGFSWFRYPFLFPPELKRKILLMDTMSQMSVEYEDACVNHTLVLHAQKLLSEGPRKDMLSISATCPYLIMEVRRSHLLQDTLMQLSKKWEDLKKPLKVKFKDEEGVDQGGVQKEFFTVLFETCVSWGLFVQLDTRLCWAEPNQPVRLYEMVGVLMGLCVYNGVMMDIQFPSVFWKIMSMESEAKADRLVLTVDDLEQGWPDLENGLRQLLMFEGDVEEVFCRDYEISIEGEEVPLAKPVVPVTNKNRESYVRDYCTYFIYTAQRDQLLALRRGMWSVLGGRAIGLCTPQELEMVACGLLQHELDMTELESVAEYDDGYSVEHPTIRQFWSVVNHDLTNEQKKQLLLFVTASDRVPVGGLKQLTFYIQRNGPDSDRLPTALTCFSRLLLPEYSSRKKLRNRLITAIENTKGFGLV